MAKAKQSGGANLGFEALLWQAADKLRGHMDAAEYKHVVLGLIFLKYISDAFEEQHANGKVSHKRAQRTQRALRSLRPFAANRFTPRQSTLGTRHSSCLAIRGIEADLDDENADSFYRDLPRNFEFQVANVEWSLDE